MIQTSALTAVETKSPMIKGITVAFILSHCSSPAFPSPLPNSLMQHHDRPNPPLPSPPTIPPLWSLSLVSHASVDILAETLLRVDTVADRHAQ